MPSAKKPRNPNTNMPMGRRPPNMPHRPDDMPKPSDMPHAVPPKKP